MNACACVCLGSALLGLLATPAQADTGPTRLADSTFQDWNGLLLQVPLNDGSTLNEYVARTMAGSVSGASLSVSFLPRFDCTPVISVSVSATSGTELESGREALEFMIDRKPVDFPVLFDDEESGVRYTYNADQPQSTELLARLDVGSRVSVYFSADKAAAALVTESAAVDPQSVQNEQIEFSLLGSSSSAQAVKEHCLAHIPIPFEN